MAAKQFKPPHIDKVINLWNYEELKETMEAEGLTSKKDEEKSFVYFKEQILQYAVNGSHNNFS